MDPADEPLVPGRETRELWLRVFAELVHDAHEELAAGPAVGALGKQALAILEEVSLPIPEEPLAGGAAEAAALIRRAASAGLRPGGHGYFAYVPGTGLFATAMADLVAGSLNRFTGVAPASPALARLESDVLRWLAAEFGYDERARGVLLSGGSLANMVGAVTARDAILGPEPDLRLATAYVSSQVHHCVPRALRFAGIPGSGIREVPVDDAWRMDAVALAASITRDREDGRTPFLVVATAGTTNTGAVDPLPAIAHIVKGERIWLHVDAAYGGAFVLCEEGRRVLEGMSRGDSIAFDPHKGLHLPFGTGALLVKRGGRLAAAHSSDAHYLQDFEGVDSRRNTPSPTSLGPELSRDYRGLRLWLPLMLHGARAFRESLAATLSLSQQFHEELSAHITAGLPVEIVAAPQLSITAFRLTRRDGEQLDDWNARNAAWLGRVNARKRVYLSSTALPVADGEAFTQRVCVLSARTGAADVGNCLTDLVETVRPSS